MVRDQALALSGLKSEKMYGLSVYLPQPPNLWQAAFNGQRTRATSSGEDRYRRGFTRFCHAPCRIHRWPPSMRRAGRFCTVRPNSHNNTPLQSFVTMNDEAYVEFMQAMAHRIFTEGGATAADRLKFALDSRWPSRLRRIGWQR